MNHAIHDLTEGLHEFAEAKRVILQFTDSMSDEQLKAQPLSGWSLVQVLEHIMHSEASTLAYMKKKTSSGWDSLEDTTDAHQQTAWALHERLLSSEKYQAPSVLPEPQNALGTQEIIEQWNLIRADWSLWLDAFDPIYLNKLVFRQPVAGMLTLVHTIRFLTLHIHHHLPQMRANRAALV